MTAYSATLNQAGRPSAVARRQPAESDQWLKRGLDVALVVLSAALVLPLIGLAAVAIQLGQNPPTVGRRERWDYPPYKH